MWRPIPNYEDIYEVDQNGNVRRIDTKYVLRGAIGPDGYRRVGLTKNKETKLYLVHRLVAFAFIPNPNNYPCINHKDENKQNNNVDNLEWCSYSYNLNYGTRNERANKTRKKPISQFTRTGDFIRDWDSVTDIGSATGFDMGHISSCCKGKRKTANGYCWRYKLGGK